MRFTTHLELHSQTTRLVEYDPYAVIVKTTQAQDGILTLLDTLFQRTYARVTTGSSHL